MNYNLVRYADDERIHRIADGNESDAVFNNHEFCTIAAHLYHGAYYPGTRPRPAADQTRFKVVLRNDKLVFDLEMDAPALGDLRDWMEKRSGGDFLDTDFVSLNFIAADYDVVRVAFKLTGERQVTKGAQPVEDSGTVVSTESAENEWTAQVEIPLDLLGYTAGSLQTEPLPFDIVRFHSTNGATTAWSPIADQLPFNENYDFPVFCFGLLSTDSLQWNDYADNRATMGTFDYDGPEEIMAGAYTSFAVDYTVGECGLEAGGSVKFNFSNEVIECSRRSRLKRHLPEKDWTPLQWDDPTKPGYVEVTCSRDDANLDLESVDAFSTKATLNADAPLEQGDIIRISVGQADECPGIRSQLLTQNKFPLKVYADPVGNGVFLSPAEFPRVDVVGGPATKLAVYSPPTPDAGETVRLKVTAINALGNIADSYTGEVEFSCPVEVDGLPERCEFAPSDEGTMTFDVRFQDEDVFQVLAEDVERPSVNGASNLIVTDGSFGPGGIYFGDIHTHSQLSDGRLHPEDKFREVALQRGLDFWSLTDHGHDFNRERLQQLHTTIRDHNEDDRFATIYGFEWTNSMGLHKRMRKDHGHRNIYFREAPEVIHDGVRPDSCTPRKVHERYTEDEVDFFCINHFHCGDPESIPGVDQAVEVSGWCGDFNRDDLAETNGHQQNIFDTFDAGMNVGVVAGTDHGTEAYYDGLPAEMTAVHAKELSRDAVYEALKAGHTYGTSGQRTLLRFSVNGQMADSNAEPVQADQRDLRIVVGSVYPVQRIHVIRNRQVWKQLDGFRYGVEEYTLKDTAEDSAEGYYLIRLMTAQGHTTWSSPIFYG